MFGQGDILKKLRIHLSPREQIEPEEIFFDSSKIKEFEEEEIPGKKLEQAISFNVFRVFSLIQHALALFFVGYSAFLITQNGEGYQARSADNSSRAFPIFAERGNIYSSDAKILAENKTYFDVYIDVPKFSRSEETGYDLRGLSGDIAEALEKSEKEIYEKLLSAEMKGFSELPLAKGLQDAEVAKIETLITAFPFVEIRQSSRRKYPWNIAFSHVVGYTGEVSSADIALGTYARGERIGKVGIEAFYDEILRGEPGTFIKKINSQGVALGQELRNEARAGKDITLYIHAEFQEKVYEILKRHMKALRIDAGVAIVLDPQNGGVLALVSVPSFEANVFEDGILESDFERLIHDPSKPLFHRAISGEYPSGSTIKPIIAAAALEERLVTPDFLVYSGGAIHVPSAYNKDVIYTFNDWKVHGWTDMRKAIADSVNIYFYTIGGGYQNQQGLGTQKIEEYLKQFGWGKTLGVDLPGEASGLVPTPMWKKEVRGENWYIGDTYMTSIGQGDILVTPLQIAASTAVFANNGTLFTPRILSKIGNEKIPPKVIRENLISPGTIRVIREGMRGAITQGTGTLLSTLSVPVAGKTGTAQVGAARSHAWFTGFAPYENSEIVVTVLLEEGGGDTSNHAVRVARDIFEMYFGL